MLYQSGVLTMAATRVRRLGRVYWGWWIVAANSAIGFANGFHLYGATVFFLPFTESLRLSRGQLSMIFATARLEGGAEGPVLGWLIDRLGARLLLLAGAVMVGVGYVLLATVVKDFWSLFLVYTVLISTGAAAGGFAPLIASVNKWFVQRRTVAIGVVGVSIRGSQFLLTPLLSVLIIHLGWHQAAIIVGLSIMVSTLGLAWVNRPSPESMGLRPDGADLQSAHATAQAPSVQQSRPRHAFQHDFSVGEALRTPTFWLLTAAQALRFLFVGAIIIHLVPILVWKGLDRQSAANLVGLMALVSVPSVLFFGWAGDRFSLPKIAAAGAALGTIAIALLAFGPALWYVYLFIVLSGFAESNFPVIIGMTGEYFGRSSFATLRGITQLFGAVGGFAATYLTGRVFDVTGGYTLALVPLVFVSAASVPLFLMIRYPKPPKSAAPALGGANDSTTIPG